MDRCCLMHNNTSVAVLLGKGFYGRCLMTVSTVSDLIATGCADSRLPRSTWGLARHGNVVVDTNYNWNCMRHAGPQARSVLCLPWTLRFPPAQQLGQFFIIFMPHLAHVLIKSSPESPLGSLQLVEAGGRRRRMALACKSTHHC